MNIFEHPEIEKLFSILRQSLFRESGRGALLIATAYVEEYLTSLIEKSFPKEISQNHKDRLLNYPGPLSSFASKIELAYAFRLINSNSYNSLNALRKLRNDAAHKTHSFELHELNEKLKNVYNLGDGITTFTREMSMKLFLHDKAAIFEQHYKDSNLSAEEKEKKMKELFTDEKFLKALEEQAPFWEMVLGLCLLCYIIINETERISALTLNISTWSNLLKEKAVVE